MVKRYLFFVCLVLLACLPQHVAAQATQLFNSNVVIVGHENMCTTGPTSTPAGPPTAYACTLDRAITTYAPRACFAFIADTSNTGAASLNLHGIGARTIKKVTGGITTDLVANDIRTGQFVKVCNDGTNFQMVSQLGNAPTGGSATILDLADNGTNESTALAEIATTGDTNSIFTEPAADKLLINVGAKWPAANTTDALATDPTACPANQFVTDINAAGTLTCAAAPAGGVTTDTAQRAAFYNSTTTVDGATALTFATDGTTLTSTAPRITALSATTTLDPTHGPIVACSSGASDITLTLPPGATTTQRQWTIVKVDSGAGRCLVDANASETLNGSPNILAVDLQRERVDLTLDNSGTPNWSAVVSKLESVTTQRFITIECVAEGTALVANAAAPLCFWNVPEALAGWVVTGVKAAVGTVASAGGNGAVNVDIDICAATATGNKCTGTNRDLLSTNLTMDQNEDSSATASVPAVINASNRTLAADEWVRWMVDATNTGAAGLYVTLVIQKP